MDSPLVSICCITYNHEPYIRQCIEGFLMQKTTFQFEVLIHDDASTDNTANIIREYEAKYPDIIKPIYQTENQYSKGVKISSTYNYPRAKGKYIAICEGDDYWIDALKLQKQIDILEKNKEYGLSHTAVQCYEENNKKYYEKSIERLNITKDSNIDLKERILSGDYIIRPLTVVLHKKILLDVIEKDKFLFNSSLFLMGDTPTWVELANISKVHYINDTTGVYRIYNGSASHQSNLKKVLRFNLSMTELRMYFVDKYDLSSTYTKRVHKTYNKILLRYLFFAPEYDYYFPLTTGTLIEKLTLMLLRLSPVRNVIKNIFIIAHKVKS